MIKRIKSKNLVVIAGALLLSVLLTYITATNKNDIQAVESLNIIEDKSFLDQKIVSTLDEPIKVKKMYHESKLIAVVSSTEKIDEHIDTVYSKEYEESFPDTRLNLSDDIYFSEALSYNYYEDIDDAIIEYLDTNNLYAVQVNKITFSNGAIIYVKNLEDFEKAEKAFSLNFVDEKTFSLLQESKPIPKLTTYGEQVTNIKVKETITKELGTTDISNILLDEASITQFLSYGYNPEVETYVTEEYDTVAGIATQNGMTPKQLVIINSDKLSNEDQILVPDTELKTSSFNSPFTVTVEKDRLTRETIAAPEPKYVKDDTVREGIQIVDVVEQNGYQDSYYKDTYINGSSQNSELIKSTVVKEPVQSVIRVGTYVEPRIGSGNFSWPLANAYVLCGWGCYDRHFGTDFSTYGSGYGPILAVDRGVVVENSFQGGQGWGWGYYTKIDHGNGYHSLYAHMESPGYLPVGSTVAKGQNIGYVGMTGATTYPHVHLEIYEYGTKINSCTVLDC